MEGLEIWKRASLAIFLIKRIRRSELVMFQIGRQSAVGSGLHGLQSLLLRQTGVSSSTELMKRQWLLLHKKKKQSWPRSLSLGVGAWWMRAHDGYSGRLFEEGGREYRALVQAERYPALVVALGGEDSQPGPGGPAGTT